MELYICCHMRKVDMIEEQPESIDQDINIRTQ
jgi:hypothetical protein